MLHSICQKVLFVKSKEVLYHQSTGTTIFLENKKLQKWHNDDMSRLTFCRSSPSCSKCGQRYPPDKSLPSGVTQSVSPILIRWIVIYPVDSAIQRLNNQGLGSTSDWSCIGANLIQQIRSTTQIWVSTCDQYGISALVPQTSFCWETSGDVTKCWLFPQASTVHLMTCKLLLLEFISE